MVKDLIIAYLLREQYEKTGKVELILDWEELYVLQEELLARGVKYPVNVDFVDEYMQTYVSIPKQVAKIIYQ